MQTSSGRRSFSLSRDVRGFAIGMLSGAVLAVTGTALAQGGDRGPEMMQAVLYALAELAIDTESNATRIVALRDRIDDLELRVAEIKGSKN